MSCVRGVPRRCRPVRGVDGTGRGHRWVPPRAQIAAYVATTRVRTKVNDLLATGASYAMVLRAPRRTTMPTSKSMTGDH